MNRALFILLGLVALASRCSADQSALPPLAEREFSIEDEAAGQELTFHRENEALVAIWRFLGSGRPVLAEVRCAVEIKSPRCIEFDLIRGDGIRDRVKLLLSEHDEVRAFLNGVRIFLVEKKAGQGAHEEAIEQLERDIKWMHEHAATPYEKLRAQFADRIAHPGDYQKELKRIRIDDGVEQFEAWLLAQEFFGLTFGGCGAVDVPIKEGTRWRVPIAIGQAARSAIIWVDAATGQATSDTSGTVDSLMADSSPNKAR